jgi:hypothetical protein
MADLIALGRRAIAAGFRWEAGCRIIYGGPDRAESHGLHGVPARILVVYRDCPDAGGVLVYGEHDGDKAGCWEEHRTIGVPRRVPDFSDPATVGILEAQVAADCDLYTACFVKDSGWSIEVNDRHTYGDTKAEGLVAALEALKGVIRG